MNELFEIQESKSPRLRWMERHHISTRDVGENMPPEKRWTAIHGMAPIAFGPTENDALIAAARALQIKSWKEEA